MNFHYLWFLIGNVVFQYIPLFACELTRRVNPQYRLFDIFSLLILNLTCGCALHKDFRDYGYCVLVPFGDFDGGELVFPKYQIAVKLDPGDVAIFRSSVLEHGNLPYTVHLCMFCFVSQLLVNLAISYSIHQMHKFHESCLLHIRHL